MRTSSWRSPIARAYYNEIDAYAAGWLRNLIGAGLIAPGDVDQRAIQDVQPDDLRGYAQCHFFAGIGGWSLALRLAGWPDDRPVWTGSCPCQPFSSAGKRLGDKDPRHLWPQFRQLICLCDPPVVFGEQVASKAASAWLDHAFDDLECMDYACGTAVIPACSVAAPMLRYRIFFVANRASVQTRAAQPDHSSTQSRKERAQGQEPHRGLSGDSCGAHWISEPNVPVVVDGFPRIVDQISAAGNAIVPQVAAEFIGAYMEIADA
ncbi:MAG: DNA cytosine methyltransferase [Phycisphaerae bacterium]|nr:DNA cytosine methyltransferase [Phycisphaerae bacterium]